MSDKLTNSLRAGKVYPTLRAQDQHHAALDGANTQAQSALPSVPGHSVAPMGTDTVPLAIKGVPASSGRPQ